MNLEATFTALADPNRRALLERLETGEQTLSDLASPLPISLMAIQKHVHVLEKAELVTTSKTGRSRYVRLRIDGLRYAADWMQNAEVDGTPHWAGSEKSWRRRNKNEPEQNRKQGYKGSRSLHYTYFRRTTRKCVEGMDGSQTS